MAENIDLQSDFTKKEFDKKFYNILNQFTALDFDSDLFFRITDFTKQIALVPCSGKTREGISELLVMLAGLAQRFLKGKLSLGKEGKGTILEIKKEKGFLTIEAVLYDGALSEGDTLAIATIGKIVEAKVRGLFNALPLGKGYEPVKEVIAASGIQLYLATEEELVPGMPFMVIKTTKKEELDKMKAVLEKEIAQALVTDNEGIIAKAESLGSLEALLFLLRKEGIMVKKAGIGNIKREDISLAMANLETSPLDACIIAFNVAIEPETATDEKIKIIEGEVVYRIIEDLLKWRQAKSLEIERENLAALTLPCKLKILPNAMFRQSKPAIFGVRVDAGILKSGILLMNAEGEEIDKVKGIQSEGKNVDKAGQGKELAISLPNTTFGRQIKENETLYSILNEPEFRALKENKKYLSQSEISCLQEIANIKRKVKPTWGI